MTESLTERPAAGEVPRYELNEWRERYGVVAGITGRGPAAGAGFDLGLWTDQPVGEVMQRWRTFRHAEAGFGGMVVGHQVHRADVAWHESARGWAQLDAVDGHATATPGVMLAVTVADCIPVYLAAPRHGAIALLHAGWRGTASGILARGVELLKRQAGASPADLVMHAGVGICGSCYEVGPEVVSGVGLVPEGAGPWHVDLRETLARQAAALGVAAISMSTLCSAHDRPAFYSHRASGGRDGRMVAYLGIPSAPAA